MRLRVSKVSTSTSIQSERIIDTADTAAQTVANFYLAFSQGLQLIPVINKIDLASADADRALEQMKNSFELDPKAAVLVSAKSGKNVESILPAVVEKIPA